MSYPHRHEGPTEVSACGSLCITHFQEGLAGSSGQRVCTCPSSSRCLCAMLPARPSALGDRPQLLTLYCSWHAVSACSLPGPVLCKDKENSSCFRGLTIQQAEPHVRNKCDPGFLRAVSARAQRKMFLAPSPEWCRSAKMPSAGSASWKKRPGVDRATWACMLCRLP